MAAFSYQHYPFHQDTLFLPNSPIKMSEQLEQPNTTTTKTTTCFSQIYPHENPQKSPAYESSCLEHASKVALSNNETSETYNKPSTDSSISMLDRLESGEQVTQKVTPMDKKRKSRHGSSFNSVQSKNAREVKEKKQRKCNGVIKNVEEKKGKAVKKKEEKKVGEEAPTGYIHVRARRGQATDSHSLAERVRREKISERMKLLQALVPGCDKVTGKALVLDEIINYVQSLQHQLEFLSMKLASLNLVLYDFGIDLDTFLVSSERLNGLATPLPNVQQCNPAQPTVFSDATTTFTASTASNYPLLDTSSSLVFQQRQRPDVLSQDNGQLSWDVDEQRQKYIDQFANSNNWCSFH